MSPGGSPTGMVRARCAAASVGSVGGAGGVAGAVAASDPGAVVVTLGRHSMGRFMPGARISQVHGTMRPVDPATGARDALVFAMYHPAAALRTPAIERESFDDVAQVPSALVAARERRAGHDREADAATTPGPDAATAPATPPVPPTEPAEPAEAAAHLALTIPAGGPPGDTDQLTLF